MENNQDTENIDESNLNPDTSDNTNQEQEAASEQKTDQEPVNEESANKSTDTDFRIPLSPVELNKVFVISGPDVTMRQQVESFLRSLNLTPVFTYQKTGEFRPIGEMYNLHRNINFVIALLYADEFTYPKDKGSPKDAVMKSHSKVVFELGYCIGKFGRDRVVALYYDQKSYRCPSEFFDAMYIPMDKKNLWQNELKSKLTNAGLTVKLTK